MKNKEKRNAIFRMVGFIAVVAIIAFAMIGCDDLLKMLETELSGKITISPSSGTVGTQLTATYSGSEEVTYAWKRDGSNVGSGTTKHTTTQAGSYTVTVSADGYKDKTSSAVTITAPELPGTLTVSPSSGTVGVQLTATYSGNVTVTYQWKNGTANVGTNSNKHTTDAAGSYTVTVSASGYNPKTSMAVTITAPEPPQLPDSIGTNPVSGKTYYRGTTKFEFSTTTANATNGTYTRESPEIDINSPSTSYDKVENGKYKYRIEVTGFYTWDTSAKTITLTPEKINDGSLKTQAEYRISADGTITTLLNYNTLEKLLDSYKINYPESELKTRNDLLDAMVNAEFGNKTYLYTFSNDGKALFLDQKKANKGSNELSGKTFLGTRSFYNEDFGEYTIKKDEDFEYKFTSASNFTHSNKMDGYELELTGTYTYNSVSKVVSFNIVTYDGKTMEQEYSGMSVPATHYFIDADAYKAAKTNDKFLNPSLTFFKSNNRYNTTASIVGSEITTPELGYTLLSDGTYSVSAGAYPNTVKQITIPATYNGKRVSKIVDSAFKDFKLITRVYMEGDFDSIGNEAFKGCSALKEFSIGDATPPTLGTSVFEGVHADFGIRVKYQTAAAYRDSTSWSE